MNGACLACGAATQAVLDLGSHRLPDFTPPDWPVPVPAYPLRLMLCPACALLQLDDLTPRDLLYTGRYGFVSGVNEAVRADLESVVKYALHNYRRAGAQQPWSWLDIACNDGTLLSFVPDGTRRTGIDPLGHLAAQARRHADRIVTGYYSPDYFRRAEFDVITSVSMFYDLADPAQFAREVAEVLAPGGIWVIQQNYAAMMHARNAVDNICHEHVTYFSARALAPVLAQAGLEITDTTYSDVNGGCIRTLVTRRGDRKPGWRVQAQLDAEAVAGLHRADTWTRWGARVTAELARTREFCEQARAAGKRVQVYGASTRGGTLLQMAGIGPELVEAAVERQAAKVGKVMAATGLQIVSEAAMRADPPDFLLVTPWFFRDVFLARERDYLAAGGQMIFPLPEFELVGGG